MDIAGYVSVCVQLYCVGFDKETPKVTKENSTEKTQMEIMQSVTAWGGGGN
jgi:hypothetical protein